MSQFNTPAYDIERPTGVCTFTGEQLQPGDKYIATLVDLTAADIDAANSASAADVADAVDAKPDDSEVETDAAAQPDAAEGDDAKDAGDKKADGSNSSAKPAGKTQLGLKRLDVSLEAWEAGNRPDYLFSYWRSTVPQPNEKKRMFVDDDVLVDLFRRLGDEDQSHRAAFRFVLGLILMRKKKLRYMGTEVDPPAKDAPEGSDDVEVWIMQPIPKPEEEDLMRMVNPHMDEQQVQTVTEELGEILDSDFDGE